MEEIEYLEEYEDLVLPALNSAAAAASAVSTDATKSFKNSQNQKFNDGGDDSSSSLDQDIFNCLFDDNSDDDDEDDYNVYEQGDENNIKQVEVLRQDQKSKTNTFDKEANKLTSSTPKPKTFAAKSSGTTISINRAQSSFAIKPKSVATVRPTVQNQLYQTKQKKTNTIQRSTTTTFIQQQHQQHQQRPTTSTASTSRSHQLPILARKPLSTATASSSSSTLVGKKITLPSPSLKTNTLVKKVAKRPATIVKPEKIITKDPVNDPLNLDDLSEIGSDNYSLSDISGETYNSVSEFDDDDSNDEYYSGDNVDYYEDADDDNISSSSQIIELSNDSSGSQTKLEDLRAPTPSPVISDDSDTSSSLFNLKLRKPCSTKPYSHPIIIESVLKKGDKPKLLDLLSQYNLLDDSVENDSEDEANVVIDITRSKENLLENLEVDTAQRAFSPLTPVDAAIVVDNKKSIKEKPTTGCSTSSVSTDKNKSKKKRLKKMDRTNANRDSTDSDLSAVEELLEESYAEAMKRIKDAPLSSQEVGAELEIGGEEEVTAVEVVKNPEDNKLKQTKPGIVIDYDDNPLEQESTNSKKAENSSKEELETKGNNIEEEKEKINKVIEKEIELEIKKEIGQKSTDLEKIELSDEILKDLNKNKSNEITDITESSSSKPTKNNEEKPSLNEISTTTFSKSEDIAKEDDSPGDSAETISASVSSDSLNIRKKKRFRNLKTPDPSDSTTAIQKSLDDDKDFKGFEDGVKVVEDGQKLKPKIVEEQGLDKSMETKPNKAKDDSSGSFKSPTSSHKSLHDKHRETKEKISSRDSSRDSSKDRNSKESKSKSSRESSKEKSSRENSKDRSSRENSKDRSRESSKDRAKTLVKDHIDHRKSNDSKESSRSRESSKSRDSKDTKHSKSDSKEFHRHSNDKKDKTHEITKEKSVDKTKTLGSDNKDKKDYEPKKHSKDNKESSEKKSDTLKPKKLTEEVNKIKAKEDDVGKTPKATPTKGFKNSNIQKKSTDSPIASSSSKNSSCSTSRDSSKDRKEVKKPVESSNESLDRNKVDNLSTLPGNKMKSNKPTPTKTVSNSDEKQKDKINVTQKSSDSIKDCKPITSDTKPVKENTDLKAQMPKSNDSKSSDSNTKNTKPNLIVKSVVPTKTTTQSPNVKPMVKSNTSLNKSTTSLNKSNTTLNKSTTSLNKSTTSLNKSTTSLNKSNTNLNKSNTGLDKTPQKPNDSKINKDPNSKTVTADSKVKNTTAKPTTQISDKSNITKPTTDAKAPKKIADDKKVLQNDDNANKNVSLQQRDKLVDPNKKFSSDAANKPINKTQNANKDLSTEMTSKTINKIESKNEPSKAHSTPEKAKGTNIIPTTTQSAANNSSNIKKPTLGVDSKSVIKNVKDGAKPNIVNKSPSGPAKKFIKKPDENKHKDKADVCKKGDLQKQPNLKTTSEKPPTKEINNISEDNEKADKTVTMSPKKDLKPKPVIMKAKSETLQKKCEPDKTKNPTEIKSDNVGLKKSTEIKPPVSGNIQMDKNVPKTETIKQRDVLVKSKTETLKTQQSKQEDIKPVATDKSDLKLKTENKTDSVKSNKPEESSTENKEATKSLSHEVKSISGNQADSTKTTKAEESSKENENKTQPIPKPAVSSAEVKAIAGNQTDSTETTKSEESSKENENKTQTKPAVSVAEVKSKSENQTDSTKPIKPEETCNENENKIQPKHKPGGSEAEVKSKSRNQTDSPKPQEICRENKKEIEPKPRASEPNIKVKILKPKKASVNNPESKADSIKEASKVCDKKGNETKTAEAIEKPLSSSSSSNDKEVETKSSKEATTANIKTKDAKTSETTAVKKDALKVSEKTSKISNKTEEIKDDTQEESSKKSVEMEKSNETSAKPAPSKHAVITKETTSEKGKTKLLASTVKGEAMVNKSEPDIKPNISSKSVKDQQTNELPQESTEKQELPAKTEETIEPRVTRSRMEIIKANEDIHEPINSGKCADLKLESKEVEELKLEPSKTEHGEEVKTSETIIDKDIKTDDTIVELNHAKNPSEKCEDKAKEEDTRLKEEKEKVEICVEKNLDKDELKEVEPMRTRNRSKILIDDGKSQGFETPPPLVDAKNQICDVKPETLKLEESKAKEEVSDVITTEEVAEENKFEPMRTRKRADNKSDSKIKEGNASEEHSLSEMTCEKSTIELKDKPGSSSMGIRTRKHVEIEADEKKLTEESGASTIGTKSLAVEEKGTTEEVAKTDGDNFEPKRTRKYMDHKADESTNITIKDQSESEKIIEDAATERITEKTSLETEKANEHNSEPVRTRKRGDIKASDMDLKESVDESGEDKKDTSDHTNKETRTRKRGDVVKSVDLKQKESSETSDNDKKDQTSKEIVAEADNLNKKESPETSEKVQKDIKDQKNKEISEPITTRRRGEAFKSTDVHQKESTKENDRGATDQTNKEIIEPVKTRKRGEVVKQVNSNQKESTETFDETNNDAKDQTIKEIIIGPIKTRSRSDGKATDLNTNEVLEISGRDKKDTRDQTNKEMIESVKPTKTAQVQSTIVNEKTDENKLEPIKTRKRLDINDDFKQKESKEQTNGEMIETVRTRRRLEDKNITSIEKTVEDKSEHIPTRNRADNKTEDLKVIKKNYKEATTNDNEQSKQDTLDRTDTIETSSDTSINSDYSLKRILRKRGTESPLSENDNKKLFKEPTVKSIYATTPKSAKDEKPLTNVVATGSKRSLRSPVSEASSPMTVKKPKLDVPKKTTRFRNLHDDCLEEEELPVITASDSAVTNELENLNVGAPKELEEKHQLTKKPVRKEVSESKNIVSQLDQESIQNVVTHREKATSETETKNLPRKEVKEIETVQNTENTKSLKSSSTINLKAKPISEEVSNSLQNNEKQNIPEQSKYKKDKANTSPTKSAGSSSVLSFSDWLKTKEQSTKSDDNLEEKSVRSTTNTEKSTEKTKENIRIKAKSMPKVVDAQDQNKLSEGSEEQESLIENTQENETETMARSKNRRGRWRNKSNNKDNSNQSKAGNSNATTTAANSKNSQLDVQDDNSSDSKIKIEKLQAPTPTLVRVKKREIQVLIESMSKEMKDGGISDLLNTETHVKRQRLATKRNFSGSSEHLNTTSNITTKEATVTATSATTAGTVLSKDVPKVIEFAESTEMLPPSLKELNRSPSKRKQQQNATKSTRATSHKSITDYVDSNSDMKLRKSLNPKDLTSHTSSREVLSPSTATKLRKSMPQTKETNIEKISSAREEKTTYLKTRRTLPSMKEPSNVQEKGMNKNISPVFKAPKPVVHTAVYNATIGQESLEKLHVEDNKRSQSRNKKPSKVVKTFKCREVRVRLNRSKVKKYLSVLHDRNNQVTASSGKTVEDDSSIIQNNADSNLRIQSVVDKRNLMDLSTDYNPNNVFVPQDSYMQTNITSDTIQLDPTLPSVSLANQSYEAAPISSHTMASLPIINAADPSEHIELKNEFMDENPIDLVNEALLPDTPTLLARAQTITEAAQHALSHSVAPTDIRLLTTESTGNAFVPSFGVTPTVLDNRGTCMYTFLHPAKYNRNHSNVLLDYCCPNLDGPMPAIDPTRIHAQVQVPVIELPASIVLTTKIVTRADLESENSTVPAIIRRKAEKIRNNLAAHHKVATAASVASTTQQTQYSVMQPQSSTTRFPLPPTINALTKQLPATTTITAKIRPTQHQDVVAQSHTIPNHTTTSSSTTAPINTNTGVISVIPKGPPQLSQMQKSSLRSNLRRFDVLLKELVQPFDNLTFVDRHRIIEAIISTGKLLPKDLDRTISLMEEYIKQTTLMNNDKINTQTLTAPIPLPSATTTISTNNYHMTHMTQSPNSCSLTTMQMPQLQPSPQLLAPVSATTSAASSYCRQQLEQLHTKTVKTVQTSSSTAGTPAEGTVIKQRQVPIYDAERNIIGYQMKMLTPMASVPAYTKSTMSTHTGAIMSTSLDSSSNKTISYTVSKRPVKRPAQDSPRVFYTTPPLQTSTPKGITNPTHMYPTTQKQSTNSKAIAQKTQKGSIVTALRSGGSSASSASSETITTTTMATVKRVTRSTATGSKIIIVSKSNQSNEETILPDTNNQQQPEIKNEKDIEEFLG